MKIRPKILRHCEEARQSRRGNPELFFMALDCFGRCALSQ